MDRLTFQIIYNYIVYLSKHNFEISELMLTVFGRSKRIKKFLRFTSIQDLKNYGDKYNLFLPIPLRVFGKSPYDLDYDGKVYFNVMSDSDDFYFLEKISAKNTTFKNVDVEYVSLYERNKVRINQNKTFNRDLKYQYEDENYRFKMLFKVIYDIQDLIHDIIDKGISNDSTDIPATDVINMLTNGKVIGDYYFARRNGIEYSTVEIGLCNQNELIKPTHEINCSNADIEDTAYVVNMEQLTYILKKIGS